MPFWLMYLENKTYKDWGDDGGLGKPKITKIIIINYKFSNAIRHKINTKSSSLHTCKQKVEWRHRRQDTTGNNNNNKIKYLGINIKHVQDPHENQPADSAMNLF